MEQFVGFDVSQSETSVCVVDEAGKVWWQGKCASTPEAMAATVQRRAPHAIRIALETGPMSAWHWRSLVQRFHETTLITRPGQSCRSKYG